MKSITITVAIVLSAISSASAQTPALAKSHAEVLGKWVGSVVATIGEMPINVTLNVDEKTGKKVIGEIANPHGAFLVTGVTKTNGKWVVSFSADGATGKMIGTVTEGVDVVFKGDWDFSPRTTGTFELRRPKK